MRTVPYPPDLPRDMLLYLAGGNLRGDSYRAVCDPAAQERGLNIQLGRNVEFVRNRRSVFLSLAHALCRQILYLPIH